MPASWGWRWRWGYSVGGGRYFVKLSWNKKFSGTWETWNSGGIVYCLQWSPKMEIQDAGVGSGQRRLKLSLLCIDLAPGGCHKQGEPLLTTPDPNLEKKMAFRADATRQAAGILPPPDTFSLPRLRLVVLGLQIPTLCSVETLYSLWLIAAT